MLLKDLHYYPGLPSTPEDLRNDGKVRNVKHAKERIETIINSVHMQKINQTRTTTMSKAGTLHIYTDGSAPMKYVPYNP